MSTITAIAQRFDGSLEKAVKAAIAAAIALFLLYTAGIAAITFSIVERKATEGATKDLQSRVASLELQYLAETAAIDVAYARSVGYVTVSTPSYANRTSGMALLSAGHDAL